MLCNLPERTRHRECDSANGGEDFPPGSTQGEGQISAVVLKGWSSRLAGIVHGGRGSMPERLGAGVIGTDRAATRRVEALRRMDRS